MSDQSSQNLAPSSISTISFTSVPSNSVEEDIDELQKSFVFPFFSEITRSVNFPSFFSLLQYIIQVFQAFVAHMFIGNHHIWKSISSTPKIFRYFSYIVNFGIIDKMNQNNLGSSDDFITKDDFYNCWPFYISIISFFIVEIVFIVIILFYYNKKRSFLKWTLYVSYFFLNILNHIFFVPFCSLSGYAIWQIDCHRSISSIIYLLISIIPSLLLFMIILYNSIFTCNSVYLSRSIDTCWDSKIKSIFTISNGITAFLGPFLNPFARWFVFCGLLLSIFLNIYQLYLLYYLPYIKEVMNIVIQSTCVLSIIQAIITCFHYNINVNFIVHIIVPLIFFAGFCVLYFYFDKYKIKKVLQKLNYQNKNMTENEKNEFSQSINALTVNMVLFYIRMGITYLSPSCYDFSMIKLIHSIRNTSDIAFPLIQITVMFPSQMQFLSILMAPFNRKDINLSISQNFVIYQSKKIIILRQSVSSKAEKKSAHHLFKLSEESISLIRGFWNEINFLNNSISTASLRYFKNATNRTSSSYLDALNQYPKSIKIYEQYIRFLLEAKGDYKGSIYYMKNLIMIQRGRHIINDSVFKCFVNVFPKYLTEQILDNNGFYINQEEMQLPSEFITNNTTNINSSDFHDDDIAISLFDHSKLRLSLQAIIDKSSLKSLKILRGFSIMSFLLITMVMFVLYYFISNTSNDLHDFVKSISVTSKILTNIQHAQLIIGTRYLEYYSRGYFYYELDYQQIGFLYVKFCEVLNIKNTSISKEPSIFKNPYIKLNILAKEIRELLNEEMTIIYSNPSKHSGEIFLLGEWSFDTYHQAFYNYNPDVGVIVPLLLSLKGIVDTVIKQIDFLSSKNSSSYKEDAFLYTDIFSYLISCLNGMEIGQNFDILFLNISQTGINDCDSYSSTYDILSYFIPILVFIIFFIGRLANFIYMINEFKNLSKLLKGFRKDEISEFFKPIYLKDKQKLPTGTVHSSNDFSIEIWFIPFIFLLMTVDCIFVVVYSCINTQKFFDKFSNFFEWSNGAAQRASTILKIVLAFHLEAQFNFNEAMQTNETKGENLVNNLKKIEQYQYLIDTQIIGNDFRFDDFYYSSHCEKLNSTYDFADFSDCLSVSNKLNLIIGKLNDMKKVYTNYDLFKSSEYAALMYNIDKSIVKEFISLFDYLIDLSKKISDEHKNDVEIISIVGFIIAVVLFVIENFFISFLFISLDGFKQLIYIVPPLIISNNNDLMDFLIETKTKIVTKTTEDIVVNSSQLGIISINENLIIQSVNSFFSKMTDISPPKLLGQSITFLIPVPTDENGKITFERSEFYRVINEMKNNFSNDDVYTLKLKIKTDDSNILHVNANLIKVVDLFSCFKGFKIIMKNIEEDLVLKNQLEQEKNQTNNLINILIPNGALNIIKREKESFFFKADEASLIFIEIVGMEDYISFMSPKSMMEILDSIYNEIDKILTKYKSISMIQWENNMIFAVSGLFDNIGDFKRQAYESAAFLTEVIQSLEETNIKFSTDFHMKLGAHIGGPIMGFIQDQNNPCFDLRCATFKYINYMKENGPTDTPQFTASLVKYLDTNIVETIKLSTFIFNESKEDIFAVNFKEEHILKNQNMDEKEKDERLDDDENDDRMKEDKKDEITNNEESNNASDKNDSTKFSSNDDISINTNDSEESVNMNANDL